jgi:hypothetical protein
MSGGEGGEEEDFIDTYADFVLHVVNEVNTW